MKTLKDFNFKNEEVLVRCDFNVPLDEKGKILDDFRISQTIPTIEYLIKKRAKIILMSHLDNPRGKVVESLRLTSVQNKLREYLKVPVNKAEDCIGKKVKDRISQIQPGEILLLENLRFHKGEEDNDEDFAKELAKLGSIYINDAFGVCHRNHASVVGIPKYLSSGAGFLLEKEIKVLSKMLEKPLRPLVVIIGGMKISTKIKVIEKFLEKADHFLLGGEIANAILAQKGILLTPSLLEPKVIEKIEKIDLTNSKLHLPVDGVISFKDIKKGLKEGYLREAALGRVRKEEKVYDLGPETIRLFSEIIKGHKVSFWKGPLEYIERKKAPKTIFWSGPLGMFENEKFEKGTREIANTVARNYSAFKIAGGGDTISALNKFGLIDKFDHVSTGGGAMLDFLAGEKLPGIEALK